MNPPPHLDANQITLLYFDEAPAAEHDHVAGCPACRERYNDLAVFLNALQAGPVPMPDLAWELRLWNRLEPGVTQTLARRSRRPYGAWLQRMFGGGTINRRAWRAVPALALLIVAAFFLGRYTRPASTLIAFTPQARDRVFLLTLGDHLDRSQIVLTELVNAAPDRPFDIAGERQLAGSLVGENRLLRQIVARKGDRSDTAVLDDLERVLLEIAHAPTEVSPAGLDHLRRRIEAQGLLFKVRVVGANVREKGMKL